jgi:hypothetical protein
MLFGPVPGNSEHAGRTAAIIPAKINEPNRLARTDTRFSLAEKMGIRPHIPAQNERPNTKSALTWMPKAAPRIPKLVV